MRQFIEWYKDDFGGFDTAREYAEAVWNEAQEGLEAEIEQRAEIIAQAKIAEALEGYRIQIDRRGELLEISSRMAVSWLGSLNGSSVELTNRAYNFVSGAKALVHEVDEVSGTRE